MRETERIQIRLLKQSDIPAAMSLKESAGWNQTEDDWRCLLHLEPAGCFAAWIDEELVGTTTTTTYGEQLAWVGMVLVLPAKRRLGIATELLKVALDYLAGRAETVKLDATPQGRFVYQHFGFEVESCIERWIGVGATGNQRSSETVVRWTNLDDQRRELFTLDAEAFNADRARLLDALLDKDLLGPMLSRSGACGLEGYAFARRGSRANYLGPMVMKNVEQTGTLLDSVLGGLVGQPVYLDLNLEFEAGFRVLANRGFAKQRDLIRMRRGKPTRKTSSSIVAIAGPEIG
ncbi:MAG: GNAT family N-acetyltransferase [Pyrinomonadaceae bacterium]